MNEIIYGIHAVEILLERNPKRFLSVYLLKSHNNRRLQSLNQKLEKSGIIIQMATRQWLNEKSNGAVHQGVLAYVQKIQRFQEKDLLDILVQQTTPLLLILDGVTDPHNLGACLRCADAAGVHAVIMPRNRAAPLNAIAKKVASGAAENIPLIRVTNLVRTLCLLRKHDVMVVGATNEANHNLYQSKNLTGPLGLVMGSEGKGIRRLTREYCDELISIPMAGIVLSLNVSVATGIFLFEALRQRSSI